MAIIKSIYRELLPQGKYLSDTVVLAQAWKKSHSYIRKHNWYADALELDSSSMQLQTMIADWSLAIKAENFLPEPLKLVLAPKNAKWIFPERVVAPQSFEALLEELAGPEPSFKDWVSIRDGDVSLQKLRPLAHVPIREQVVATSMMMCLAPAVETAQGDSSEEDVLKAREAGVVSYGNRLQCEWDEIPGRGKKASFSWGNSSLYRKYFQDYRLFLARPRRVCQEFSRRCKDKHELFVISLDIKSFFDQIDARALLGQLSILQSEFETNFSIPAEKRADPEFWITCAKITTWSWEAVAQQYSSLVGDGPLGLGLPQGMVASGFFANAYLVMLDRKLSSLVQEKYSEAGFQLVDYCRYVDDVRIVIESPTSVINGGLELLKKSVMDFFVKKLDEHTSVIFSSKKLSLSEKKCSVIPYRSISQQNNLSGMMELLQAELSGTFDLDSLVQVAGGLEGLLWISDQIEDANKPAQSKLKLANISLPDTDVRDDTVKRFVASRLTQVLRNRLSMGEDVGRKNVSNNVLSTRDGLSHEFEKVARKLIKCWAENPSLTLLMRCGLDLYPHPKLLSPIIEALSAKLFFSEKLGTQDETKESWVAAYCLAELFRAGAVETGYRSAEEYPIGVDIEGFREDLAALAQKVITGITFPWYVQHQALIFLATIGHHAIVPSAAQVSPHVLLHHLMLFSPMSGQALKDSIPIALVGQQLCSNPKRFSVWLADGLNNTADDVVKSDVVNLVTLNRPDLMMQALTAAGNNKNNWKGLVPASMLELSKVRTAKSPNKPGMPVSLINVIEQPENVFSQENALLLLLKYLLKIDGIEGLLKDGLTPGDIVLRVSDWSRIQSLPAEDGVLDVEVKKNNSQHPLYAMPDWVDDDKAWLYGLGRIARAVLTGEFDFTSRKQLLTDDASKYVAMRNNWFVRRSNLLNSGKGMLDEPAPVTAWLSGFISTLLQWPGTNMRFDDVQDVTSSASRGELLTIIERRISTQRALFGNRSKTPIYVVSTSDEALENRPMRVAIVQPMLPRRNDFDVKDPTYWLPHELAKHKQHLADVCRLTNEKLRSWSSAISESTQEEKKKPIVDLILFPELSVHPEHLNHLRVLSDMLGATIFAGMTFIKSPKLGAPINQGVWLIRKNKENGSRNIEILWQGKLHPMKDETKLGVKGYRPHMTLVEFPIGITSPTRVAAAICFDATDMDLIADLRDKSDMFLVSALNQDVQTFDNMVAALNFHMYQPVILANSGEFGGSTAQAPISKHEKLIAHVHGGNQVAVSVFEVDPTLFKTTAKPKSARELKGPPAGYKGRPV